MVRPEFSNGGATKGSRRVVVIGGGVTGLTAAHWLSELAQVTLLESSPRLGGKVATTSFAGVPVETGPDSFLARVPEARQLCDELFGLDLISPATSEASVLIGDRLRGFPPDLLLGLPGKVSSVAGKKVLTSSGIRSLAREFLFGGEELKTRGSIREVLGPRLGSETVDRLVEPLVGGIYAGVASDLEFESVIPDVADALRGQRNLVRASLARQREAAKRARQVGTSEPVFLTPRSGLSTLISRLADSCTARGVSVEVGVGVESIEHSGAGTGGYLVHSKDGEFEADAVVVAVPAWKAATILHHVSPEASGFLARVPSASVAIASYAFEGSQAEMMTQLGAGFLVPRTSKSMLTATTSISNKWAKMGLNDEYLVRCSTGHSHDHRFEEFDDASLAYLLLEDLRRVVGPIGDPVSWRVDRWLHGFPQYTVGHASSLAAVRQTLAQAAAGIHLCGASFDGIGIASCIRQARRTFEAISADFSRTGNA